MRVSGCARIVTPILALAALPGCQSSSSSPRTSTFYQAGGAQASPGAVKQCRSGLTGNIYTVHGATCSQGDAEVAAGAPSATQPKASAAVGWATKKVPMTAGLQAAIEDAVRNSLKDPESARFKHTAAFRDSDGTIAACGMVNAKNSYGGYVGFEPYRAVVSEAKGRYVGAGAVFGGGKYPEAFYQVSPMCDPRNW